ncbi:hypothetical protein M2145_000031 [Lachnospiraceae bacterium PF1-21]|uniref:DUF3307 domain-containing protein n=1 Tax=Ohessyouella blattaphilus TaxID=2949333 RepID=UPI003E202427
MYSEYLLMLICGHMIGDFYLQSEKMARKKDEKYSGVCIHGLCYGAVLLLMSLVIKSREVIIYTSVAVVMHFIIDSLKYLYIKNIKVKSQRVTKNIFIIDQSIHLLSLLIIAFLFARGGGQVMCAFDVITEYFSLIKTSPQHVFLWVTILLIVHKPANVFIGQILAGYKPSEAEDVQMQTSDKRAGRYIGSLERIIMVILMSVGQYAAMGLVLTAKSIARYDRITKDSAFSEYYLLGTLLSTLTAIGVFLLLK